jgi:hypothetical protein
MFSSKDRNSTGNNYASIAAGRHGRDHIVVGFISTYAISVYHYRYTPSIKKHLVFI